MAPKVLRMLDLFCGLGGASAAMRKRNWDVLGIDSEQRLLPDVCADLRSWRYEGPPVDLIWASPPCDEFARWDKPASWFPNRQPPSLDLVMAAQRIIRDVKPRFWIIENVRGARRFVAPLLGQPLDRSGSVWIWGHMPALFRLPSPQPGGHKWRLSPHVRAGADPVLASLVGYERRRWLRARIPYDVSLAVAEACERATRLPGFLSVAEQLPQEVPHGA